MKERTMRKTLLMLLTVGFIYVANGNTLPTAKVAEVTNYKEVLSQIEYPKVCREKGIEGQVIVSLEVDAAGNLIGHEFVTYPCSDLKVAVQEVLSKLRFSPAVNQQGETVGGSITMPINFKLTI